MKNQAAVELGRRGGQVKSAKKVQASRDNLALGREINRIKRLNSLAQTPVENNVK
jgi:hypothetical protein